VKSLQPPAIPQVKGGQLKSVEKNSVRRDVVVIGASAGGLQALQRILARLPGGLPASVLVVIHLSPATPSRLAEVLGDVGALPAVAAVDGQRFRPGTIYTAVPDRHLLVSADDRLRLTRGPRENRVRPAADALFRAAARWCGPRVIGVVLSGTLDDGAAGLASIAQHGGVTLAQRPEDAKFDGMPKAAVAAVPDATVLPTAGLARVITELAGQPVAPLAEKPDESLKWEVDMAERGTSAAEQPGQPVGLGCPECSGGMKMVRTDNALHYVCHAGHSYSPQTLLLARDEGIESAFWTALSALQEKAIVLTELANRAAESGDLDEESRHHAAAARASHAAELLREQLLSEDRFWADA
jgi:two-component system, chemotaxis family, protein-glutamate methylesterase/glutaminase